MASSSAFHPHGEHASPLLEFVESKVRAFGTTEALRTTEGTDFEISSSVISVVLSISVVFQQVFRTKLPHSDVRRRSDAD